MVDKVELVRGAAGALASVDKSMLESKKFVAFMVIQACWTALLFYTIYAEVSDSVLLSMVAALGAAQTTFMGATAWQDTSIRTEKMKALGNRSVAAEVAPERQEKTP